MKCNLSLKCTKSCHKEVLTVQIKIGNLAFATKNTEPPSYFVYKKNWCLGVSECAERFYSFFSIYSLVEDEINVANFKFNSFYTIQKLAQEIFKDYFVLFILRFLREMFIQKYLYS